MMNFLNNGLATFGVLFPVLFVVAQATLTLIAKELLAWAFTKKEPRGEAKRHIDNLCTTATLTGSLQTIISLCIVGHQILFGQMQIGTTAFATLIQGFASTGLGISVALTGRTYTQFVMPLTQNKKKSEKEKVEVWTY